MRLQGAAIFCLTTAGCAELPDDAASQAESVQFGNTDAVLSWGSVRHVTCNSVWSCPSTRPAAIDCGGGRRLQPLMNCDSTCERALQQSYSDATPVVARPRNFTGVSCRQRVTVCYGARCVMGTVLDRSDRVRPEFWELGWGVTDPLGAPRDVTLTGVTIFGGSPISPAAVSPRNGTTVTSSSGLSLRWQSTGTSYEIYVELQQGSGWVPAATLTSNTSTVPLIYGPPPPSARPPVTYRWRVTARNELGASAPSPFSTFTFRWQ